MRRKELENIVATGKIELVGWGGDYRLGLTETRLAGQIGQVIKKW